MIHARTIEREKKEKMNITFDQLDFSLSDLLDKKKREKLTLRFNCICVLVLVLFGVNGFYFS